MMAGNGNNSRPFGPFVQIAYLVEDVNAAAADFAAKFGAGPFFVLENIDPEGSTYMGKPWPITHSSAYGWHGDMMVELVQPLVEGESVFSGFMDRIHHMAAFADDIEHALEVLAADGCPTATTARFGETPFCFVDTRAKLGHYLELYQDSDSLRGFYAMIKAASDGWDGADPVRPLSL